MATIRFTLKPGECRMVAGRRICNRWQRNTSSSTQDYIKGVKNPKRSWGKECCESADRYKKGVDRAHTKDALRRGVIKAGGRKWLTKTLQKGPTRFAQGVIGAGGAYARGYAPYHSHFPSIMLPKRFPRGDPRNIGRVGAVTVAMSRVKMGMAGTGKVTCPDD